MIERATAAFQLVIDRADSRIEQVLPGMANNDDPYRANSDPNNDLVMDWNLGDTCEFVHEGGPERKSDRSRTEPPRGESHHRIDPNSARGGPHYLGTRNRSPDTALFGAFSLNAETSTGPRGGSLGAAGRSGGGLSDTLGSAPSRCESLRSLRPSNGSGPSRFPTVGDRLGGFQVVLELGRGAFARVYLAEEINLGGRRVAIKVSAAEGDEPQILARLQHTHIVPILSVHTDSASGFRIMCMPYFGGANLAEVLESAESGSNSVAARTGRSLIQALDRVSRLAGGPAADESARTRCSAASARSSRDRSPLKPRDESELQASAHQVRGSTNSFGSMLARIVGARRHRIAGSVDSLAQPDSENCGTVSDQPSRQFLQRANGVQAAVWIVARLAEGLEHAHARGLLHRDIKPSNVLIAADGTPMLLDFNLSVEQSPNEEGEGLDRARIGGTLPYMSPEHLDAFNPQGATEPAEVDERSDIYALGLVLFEMIAGRHPFPEPPPRSSARETIRFMLESRRRTPSLRAARPDVPWSLDALTAKCLDPEPDRRYGRAKDLAEDLQRFLHDLPMKHCPEPSPRERFGKWVRRHPAITSSTSVGLFSTALLLILAFAALSLHGSARQIAARLRVQVFRQGFADSQFWLNTQSDRVDRLRKGLLLSRKALDGVGLSDSDRGVGTDWIARLPAAERDQVSEQIVELCLLDARARVRIAERLGAEGDRRIALEQAVRLIDRAERLVPGPTSTLFTERARYQDALGRADLAAVDRRKAAEIPLATSYDYLALGVSLLSDGKAVDAEAPLKEAVQRDVTSFWAWFSLGHCLLQQGRNSDAVAAFVACVVRGPNFAWARFNLGLALARSGRLTDAKSAYDQAIRLDPDFPEARINRGLVELELNQLEGAREDLELGIAAGRDDPGVLAALGETLARMGRVGEAERFFQSMLEKNSANPNLYVARGMTRLDSDPAGARLDFGKALEFDPANAPAHYGLARILRADDPAQALSHLDLAVVHDPDLIDAVQLRALIRARLGDPAACVDVDTLLEKPTPHRLYNAACALALYSDKSRDSRWSRRSLELLTRAVRLGFPSREAATDPDLASLRNLPEFQNLLTGANN